MAIPSILLVYVLACYVWGAVFALRLAIFRKTSRPKPKPTRQINPGELNLQPTNSNSFGHGLSVQ